MIKVKNEKTLEPMDLNNPSVCYCITGKQGTISYKEERSPYALINDDRTLRPGEHICIEGYKNIPDCFFYKGSNIFKSDYYFSFIKDLEKWYSRFSEEKREAWNIFIKDVKDINSYTCHEIKDIFKLFNLSWCGKFKDMGELRDKVIDCLNKPEFAITKYVVLSHLFDSRTNDYIRAFFKKEDNKGKYTVPLKYEELHPFLLKRLPERLGRERELLFTNGHCFVISLQFQRYL